LKDFLTLSTYEANIIFLTIKVAILSTIIIFPISVYLGWILARKNFVGKHLIETIITIPLVAPPVVTGYLLIIFLGKNGILGKYINQLFNINLAFNFSALVIASVVVALPLAVRSVRTAFELVNPIYEQTAETLGASKISTFFRISLPLAYQGVISGMVLSFARSLGEFGASITFAGNIEGKTQTLALMIYSNMQIPEHDFQVTRLVIISLIISFLAIFVAEYFNTRKKYLSK